jgi:uncharacterized protein involved in exopolysaccharide biosynthesis
VGGAGVIGGVSVETREVAVESRVQGQADPSFRDLIADLWRARWFIGIATLSLSLGVAVLAIVLPKKYEAKVVLSVVSKESSGGVSELAGRLGGLASLAGIGLSGNAEKDEAIAVLRSDGIIAKYIETNQLLPVLFQEVWDASAESWKVPPGEEPTLWKATRKFVDDIRDVSSNTESNLVTLTIKWRDPLVAAKWANDLIKLVNEHQRARAIEESERHIQYLKEQVSRTAEVEARQVIYEVMQGEINKVMLARGREEYAFRVVDPAVPPEDPYSPRPILWTVASLFVGFVLSCFVVFLCKALKLR